MLTQCRRHNVRLGITSIFFYGHEQTARLFEGEPAVADALFARIARATRKLLGQLLIPSIAL